MSRFMRVWFVLTAVLMLSAENATAIIRRSDRPDSRYTELAKRFPAVCMLVADGAASGTGTLIAPRWVLTAAHTLDPRTLLPNGEQVRGTHIPKFSVLFGKDEYRAIRTIKYPGYQPGIDAFDLALIELDRPVESIVPVPINVDGDELGQVITLVGFGYYGSIEESPAENHATLMEWWNTPAAQRLRRAGTNKIISVSDEVIIMRFDPPETATDLEAAFSGGDSGGPALLQVGDQWYVSGVICRGGGHRPASDDQLGVYGYRDEFLRVSNYARWIEDVTGENFGVVRHERFAVAGGFGLLTLGAGCFWWMRQLAPSRRRQIQKGVIKWGVTGVLPVAVLTGVGATGYAAWRDVSSPAVFPFMLMVMVLAAIGVRYAIGILRDTFASSHSQSANRPAFYRLLRVLLSVPVAAAAGLGALCLTQPVRVSDLLGLWPSALVFAVVVLAVVEATPLAVRWCKAVVVNTINWSRTARTELPSSNV